MTAITVQVASEVVEVFGVAEIERQVSDLLDKIALKIAAKELLNDMKKQDLSKDNKWQKARQLAWEKEKDNILKNLPLNDKLHS
jgi:hypothetical protein